MAVNKKITSSEFISVNEDYVTRLALNSKLHNIIINIKTKLKRDA
jgi:hypothetical protein